MKKLILLCLSFIILSCEPSAVRDGRYAYKKYFDETLIDPGSFKVYNEKYELDENGVKVVWTIDYGAKNRIGGMTRKEIKLTTTGKVVWDDYKSYDYR